MAGTGQHPGSDALYATDLKVTNCLSGAVTPRTELLRARFVLNPQIRLQMKNAYALCLQRSTSATMGTWM